MLPLPHHRQPFLSCCFRFYYDQEALVPSVRWFMARFRRAKTIYCFETILRRFFFCYSLCPCVYRSSFRDVDLRYKYEQTHTHTHTHSPTLSRIDKLGLYARHQEEKSTRVDCEDDRKLWCPTKKRSRGRGWRRKPRKWEYPLRRNRSPEPAMMMVAFFGMKTTGPRPRPRPPIPSEAIHRQQQYYVSRVQQPTHKLADGMVARTHT